MKEVKVWFQNKRSNYKKAMKVLQAGGDPGLPKGAPVVPGSPLCSSPVSATSPLQPYTTPLPISPPSLTHSPNQMPYSHSTSLVSSHSHNPYSLPKKTDGLGDSQGLESSREMGAHTPSMGHPPPPPPPPHPPQSSQHMGHLPQQYSPYTPPESHGHLQVSQPQDMPNPPSPNAMSSAGHHPPTSIASHCYQQQQQQQQSHLSHYHAHHPSHSSPLQSSQDSPHMSLSGSSSCLPQSQNHLLYPPVKEEYLPPPPPPPPPPSSSPQVPNSSIAHQPPPPSSPQNSYHWQPVKQEHPSYPYSWYNSDHLHLYH
ncbi:uncharacterized protein LOC135214653 [Macrobrachium nipponense]|uniref:uncharacterized protein LOC135214653 n=1 Tax=Macrobrachium nipponense TaxID=159736 RepID=UPI0030C88FE6